MKQQNYLPPVPLSAALASGIINNYFAIINNDDSNISRCTLQNWWSEWLQSTEKSSSPPNSQSNLF
jgi:hypothetical protein